MHDGLQYATILLLLFGILLNRYDVTALRKEVREEIRGLRTEMQASLTRSETKLEAGIERVREDLRQFDRTIGRHDARLDSLEGKME